MSRQGTTWLQISARRFLLRRLEAALLGRDLASVGRPHAVGLTLGCLVAAVAVAGCAALAVLHPRPGLGDARIVMSRESGALYVRVGETWHPVLNLASARLIAATSANPTPVHDSDLSHTKRGPLLGIPGAPADLAGPLPASESVWTVCDGEAPGVTTVLVGRVAVRGLGAERAVLVAPVSGAPAYLLYRGQRAVVDLADRAAVRALRLEGRKPRLVSQALLNSVPEAPPITGPHVGGAAVRTASGIPGFAVGTVLRITRVQGEEFYVVLAAGVQRIGQVTADLLRFGDSRGSADVTVVAPDAIRAAPVVNELPVSTFPDRAPEVPDAAAVCATWAPRGHGPAEVVISVGSGPPFPAGQDPVTLSQADGRGPALDSFHLPPGRSVYVAARNLSGEGTGSRYLVTDTGARFAVHDDEAAHDLGLPAAASAAPWPMLATLPSGPELSREKASVARDIVAAGPP
ncbi:type VII secretion protein EccB [Mycobacterium kubicae]|uniref:type VII secretion protein EccB n=1 Tax=Mycobacterium kubicae TaxID=120959 RepID=UPI0007FCE91B|nr:type VII secretion protein EccB [Mycobacterium kubicae]OBK52451.1 type VII secretion protein EccB [Mycobacterium kubicae]